MQSEHIDRFNIVAANILKALHSNFPAAFHPTPETIGLTDEVPEIVSGRRQTSQEYDRLSLEVKRTLNFLTDEGFVYDRQYKIGPNYVITGKGLQALARIDPSFKAPTIVGA